MFNFDDEIYLGVRFSSPNKIVFTNGCFDILHPGHVSLLAHCKKIAGSDGVVVVGLNSDESVSRIKGLTRPINEEQARAFVLRSLKYVDFVVIFGEDTPKNLIERLQPDVIVKGGDYRAEDVVGRQFAEVEIFPLQDNWSTTGIINKIR